MPLMNDDIAEFKRLLTEIIYQLERLRKIEIVEVPIKQEKKRGRPKKHG